MTAVALGACYAPQPAIGVACDPSLDNCPVGQACLLVGPDYRCSDGTLQPTDALADDASPDALADGEGQPVLDADVDAPMPIDASPGWRLVQTRSRQGNSPLAIDATEANSFLIVAVQTELTPATAVVDDGNNLYRRIPNSFATESMRNLGIELFYAQGGNAGTTEIRALGNVIRATTLYEVAGLRAANPVVEVEIFSNRPSTQVPSAPEVDTTEVGQFVLSIVIVETTVVPSVQPATFTFDHNTFGNGYAHITSNTAAAGPYAAVFQQPIGGRYCGVSAVFQ